MVGFSHVRGRSSSTRSSHSATSQDDGHSRAGSGTEDDTMTVEPEDGNVLGHIISQLRPGADLSRITLPTFILEPKSMLERITNFMQHPDTLLPLSTVEDPVDRFVAVVKMYLSGWHIRPTGAKKPLNPILGEQFTCYWDYEDGTQGYYISEQTSHHPPKSTYFYMAPQHHIRIDGTLKPRSRFLGTSAASIMEGVAFVKILNKGKGPNGETYLVTQPNMYARNILFGKMRFELGDKSFIKCAENDLTAEIDFKTKGYFGGAYNSLGGVIKRESTQETLFELSGSWVGEMFIKNIATGKQELLFDATDAKPSLPKVRPLEEQGERESRRLWEKVVVAILARDHTAATDEKTKIEEMQRSEANERLQENTEWDSKLFRRVNTEPGGSEEGQDGLDWILATDITSKDPAEQAEQIKGIIPIVSSAEGKDAKPATTTNGPHPIPEGAPVPPSSTDAKKVEAANNGATLPAPPASKSEPLLAGSPVASTDGTSSPPKEKKEHHLSKALGALGLKKTSSPSSSQSPPPAKSAPPPTAPTTSTVTEETASKGGVKDLAGTEDIKRKTVERKDTGSDGVDEFVDAEE